MEIIQSLIDRISKAQEQSFTLSDLADEAGVSLSWLSKFVNGKIPNPTIKSLNNVAAALDKRDGLH